MPSRQMMYASLSKVNLQEWEDWEKEIATDPEIIRKIQQVTVNPNKFPQLSVNKGLYFRKGSPVLPKKFSKIPTILLEFRSSLQGGHSPLLGKYERGH